MATKKETDQTQSEQPVSSYTSPMLVHNLTPYGLPYDAHQALVAVSSHHMHDAETYRAVNEALENGNLNDEVAQHLQTVRDQLRSSADAYNKARALLEKYS